MLEDITAFLDTCKPVVDMADMAVVESLVEAVTDFRELQTRARVLIAEGVILLAAQCPGPQGRSLLRTEMEAKAANEIPESRIHPVLLATANTISS